MQIFLEIKVEEEKKTFKMGFFSFLENLFLNLDIMETQITSHETFQSSCRVSSWQTIKEHHLLCLSETAAESHLAPVRRSLPGAVRGYRPWKLPATCASVTATLQRALYFLAPLRSEAAASGPGDEVGADLLHTCGFTVKHLSFSGRPRVGQRDGLVGGFIGSCGLRWWPDAPST